MSVSEKALDIAAKPSIRAVIYLLSQITTVPLVTQGEHRLDGGDGLLFLT